MVVYMEVTKDKYELPVVVADSVHELSIITGIKPNSISSAISRRMNGSYPKGRFIRVEIEE